MTTINNAGLYSTGNYYDTQGDRVSSTSALDSSGENSKTETTTPIAGVKVSLSKEVETARLRESLGLNPTGKIKLSDFKSVSKSYEKSIDSKLSEMMEKLGIDEDEKISINLDSDLNLTISESFKGKSKLEKAINSDESFKDEFKKLSANTQVVDYAKKLTTNRPSLADFMNNDTDWNSIMTMARKYDEVKASGNSFASLINTSREETPYTYVHGDSRE